MLNIAKRSVLSFVSGFPYKKKMARPSGSCSSFRTDVNTDLAPSISHIIGIITGKQN